ncbi:MAG TPA: GNAT family N-acetyltransferase [Solirubrobacterales bacterium]
MTFSFEPVDRADPRVRELYADFVREADGPLVYDREGAGIDLDEEIAKGPPTDLVPPNGVLLLATVDGKPAGLGGVRHLDTDVAEVKSMYAAPAYRGTGLGRRILARLEETALERGCHAICLDTSDYLTPAVGLYRSAGYREIPAYNENPKADLWFERQLRAAPSIDVSTESPDRDSLLQSLALQRRTLADSIVLTPVDSLPPCLADRDHTGFLHGLYLTDKEREPGNRKEAAILFGGRDQATRDLNVINDLLASTLGAAKGSLRLLSGLHAHTATFMSISKIGQTVMLLPVRAGGHFNTHAILQRLGLHTIDLPVDDRGLCIDRLAAHRLIRDERPDFIFLDRSEGLRYEDFGFLGEASGPKTIFDASHYLPQILTGRYDNPLNWGFDLMLFSLHKSFPGPQKAGVVSRKDDGLWKNLVAGLSKFVSSSHAEDSYLFGLTLLRQGWLETYTERLLETALELEAHLLQRGLPVIPRAQQGHEDWPATHHVWLRAENQDAAYAWYELLTAANLQTNYRELPYDLGHGLRLGTSFSAMAGLGPSHIEELSEVIDNVLSGGDTDILRGRVRDLAEKARSTALLPDVLDKLV